MQLYDRLVFISTCLGIFRGSLPNWSALGLLLLGLTDGSLVPLPGASDGLTILLSARNHSTWFYYAAAATIGSVAGGSVTYFFGRRHGKTILDKRLGARRTQQLTQIFSKWGFSAIMLPSMLPVPVSPFLLTAGAMQYSRNRFLAALLCGRLVKFTALAGFAAFYGRRVVLAALDRYQAPIFWIALGIIVTTSVILYYVTGRPNSSKGDLQPAIGTLSKTHKT